MELINFEELANETEKQIFRAALQVFQKKGLAGARMQEIADEAGINKSMLHYYFRSKEILFRQIFLLSLKQFLGSVMPILNNTHTNWEEKVYALTEHYTMFMKANPDLPFFVLNELRNNAEEFLGVIKIENVIMQSVFLQQLGANMENRKIRRINPAQVFVTIMSGIIFPFLGRPLVSHLVELNDSNWETFTSDRQVIVAEMLISYLKQK